MQYKLTNSQWYLMNAKNGTNHSTNHTNPNGNSKRYPNPTYPTNPTTKYRCEFVNLNCIYTAPIIGRPIIHSSAPVPKCPRDTSALVPKCLGSEVP